MLPFCSVVGVLAAFAVVVMWFPHTYSAWNLPLQQIDAPAHYYFIRRILDEGIGSATHLWPNDSYYPPLFHLLAAGLIRFTGLFGWHLNIYAAFNSVWLVTSGLVWPAGVQLLSRYWIARVDERPDQSTSTVLSWKPFSCAMAIIVPLMSVSSASHPFTMLSSGPLIAFGLSTSLLPFWLYVTLRFFDAVANRFHIGRWLIWTIALGALCMFAHPRIVFTWGLLMAPFILLRLPWKLILTAVLMVLVGAVVFFFYMMQTYKSTRYFDPSSWFHTFQPNRSISQSLHIFLSDNIAGFAGIIMGFVVIVSAAICIVVIAIPHCFAGKNYIYGECVIRRMPQHSSGIFHSAQGKMTRGRFATQSVTYAKSSERSAASNTSSATVLRKDAVSLLLSFVLVGLVYVCSTSLTGWFPNIVAAAWYRTEIRPLTMIPLGLLPMIFFAASALACFGSQKHNEVASDNQNHASSSVLPQSVTRIVVLIILAALTISCQAWNPNRQDLSKTVEHNTELRQGPADEQLTQAKYDVLRQTVRITGTDATIISDPLNGSMYGTTIFGANMLFPIYNAKAESNGAIFGQVERAFQSSDSHKVLNTICPVDPNRPEYFLSMGPQAPSLQMFTFKEQYYPFHNQRVIDEYVHNGTLVKIKDFSDLGDYAYGWALYQFGCGE
jgi:hypothetical protein